MLDWRAAREIQLSLLRHMATLQEAGHGAWQSDQLGHVSGLLKEAVQILTCEICEQLLAETEASDARNPV